MSAFETTGPPGPQGAAGPTGSTGATGPPGTLLVPEIWVTDPNGSALVAGDGQAFLIIPPEANGATLIAIRAAVITVSASGLVEVRLRNVTQAAWMLTTNVTIDAGEKNSSTALTAAVIDAAHDDVASYDEIRFDVVTGGSGVKGLVVIPTFDLP